MLPDETTVEIEVNDGMDSFDPLRLKDMSVELRSTLRLVLADIQHERAEHEGPVE
jgi:hypothetical protein